MRSFFVFPVVLVLAAGSTACERGTLTGPDAQRAYSRAAGEEGMVPAGTLIFVDDQRLPAGQRPDLDPKRIARIEILKGVAAVKLYGEEGRAGVVRIYTVQGASSKDPGNP